MDSYASMDTFGGMVLFGGVPLKVDIAPSVIFLVIYFALAIGFVFRICRKSSRIRLIFLPAIFSLARIGAFLVRVIIAVNAKNGKISSQGLYIAELILFSAGFTLIVQPSFSLIVGTVILPSLSHLGQYKRIAQLTRYLGIVPIILLVLYATDITGSNPDVSQDKTFRRVAYYLLLAMSVIGTFGTILCYKMATRSMGFRPIAMGICLWCNAFCLGLCIYRIIEAYSVVGDVINEPAVFYCVSCLLEVLVEVPFVLFNIKRLFGKKEDFSDSD